jgi:replicative DNA helicase
MPGEAQFTAAVATVAQSAETAPVPPQNLDAEESVLGAMMLSPGAIGAVSEALDAGDFYRESHAKIYRAALGLYARGEPVDAITLVDELEERGDLAGVGGRERIHELAALVPATANAGHYARIVREMATLRGLIRAGGEVARLGWERPGDARELVDQAEQIVFELSQSRVSTEFSHIEALLKESFERITALYESGEDITGVPSGFRDIDRLTSGFQPGNLIIVAARPSMGKSALALCVAANLGVRAQIPVALFTLEMSKSEVTQRLMCSEAKVESQRLRSGKLAVDDWPRLTAACDKLAKSPIYVDDTGSINMMEIRSKARRLKTQEPNLGLIIVDYLQLMTSGVSAENRVQEVSQISRQLKVLARDLDTPVLALSQLSRAVEQRHDKRPILSDLRESGCLTGDARVLLADSGRYVPIRDLIGHEGRYVLALNEDTWRLEPRKILKAFSTGTKPVFRLTTRLGRTIRATANHKFRAFGGWQRLDALEPGMRLALPRSTYAYGTPTPTMTDTELAVLGSQKRLPSKVFEQPRGSIATYLRHLWASGGTLQSRPTRFPLVRFDLSEELSRGVVSLLLRLGITARIRGACRVEVDERANIERFLGLVGAVGDRAQKQRWATEWFNGRREHARDLIPAQASSSVVSVSEVSGHVAGTALLDAEALDSDEVATPAQSDIYWDEIASIEPAGEEETFDLTVEGLHNFVAEDLTVHNSLEQDSDLVFFIYRDEYYNEESDQQGLAEVICAKHRNGPTGSEKLSFLKRYAKFADLAA